MHGKATPYQQVNRVSTLSIEPNNIDFIAKRVATWLASSFTSNTGAAKDIPDFGATLGTTIGTERTENQDRVIAARYSAKESQGRSFLLFALCDGMGGMRDGAICAEITISTLLQSLITSSDFDLHSRLDAAVENANYAVHNIYNEQGGTTLSLIAKSAQGKTIAINVGDSRLYEFTSIKNPFFQQISVDDTIAGELERLKGIEFSTQSRADYMGRLAQYIGLGDGLAPRSYDLSKFSPESGIIISSDGIHGIRNDILGKIVKHATNESEIVRRLIQLSIWTGGLDNASVICLKQNALKQMLPHKNTPCNLLEVWCPFGKLEIPIDSAHVSSLRRDNFSQNSDAPSSNKNTRESNKPLSKKKKRSRTKSEKPSKPDSVRKGKTTKAQKELDIQVSVDEGESNNDAGKDT